MSDRSDAIADRIKSGDTIEEVRGELRELPLSERLRALREGAGLSQSDVRRICDLGPMTYPKYEQGRRSPDTEILFRLYDLFGHEYDGLEIDDLRPGT